MTIRTVRFAAVAAGVLLGLFVFAVRASGSELAESLPPFEGDGFCFYVWSDTHFDGRDHEGLRDDAVNDMNRLAGKHFLSGYGLCEPVVFVIHPGDVTTNARAEMWQNEDGYTDNDFLSCAGRLQWPVFEVLGNHDADGARTCIAEAIVQRHGGTVRIDSAPGRGTTIDLIFPPAPRGDAHG